MAHPYNQKYYSNTCDWSGPTPRLLKFERLTHSGKEIEYREVCPECGGDAKLLKTAETNFKLRP